MTVFILRVIHRIQSGSIFQKTKIMLVNVKFTLNYDIGCSIDWMTLIFLIYLYSLHSGVPFGRITKSGDTTIYNFTVPWTAAPTQEDPNCLTYMYHSAVDVRKDTNSGLIGPLLVCKPEALDANNKQVSKLLELLNYKRILQMIEYSCYPC